MFYISRVIGRWIWIALCFAFAPLAVFIAGYRWQTRIIVEANQQDEMKITSFIKRFPVIARSRIVYVISFAAFSIASWHLSTLILKAVGVTIKEGFLVNIINQESLVNSVLLATVYSYILTFGMVVAIFVIAVIPDVLLKDK